MEEASKQREQPGQGLEPRDLGLSQCGRRPGRAGWRPSLLCWPLRVCVCLCGGVSFWVSALPALPKTHVLSV